MHLATENTDSAHRDFRLPRVKSINASGHKYGQALLAVGWIIWREKEWIPQGLLLESSYLRGTQTAYTLSFSKSSVPIVAQYYQFYQQGMSGYRLRIGRYLEIAKALSLELENTGYFTCLSPVHLTYRSKAKSKISGCSNGCSMTDPGIPVVVFALSDDAKKRYPGLDLSNLSDSLHEMKLSIPREYFD